MAGKEVKEIRPQPGFQERFVRSNVDVVFGGSMLGSGKTFAATLCAAEPSQDGRFRALFLRNNLGDAKAAGGILEKFTECYGDGVKVVESGEPHVDFPSGAVVEVTHVNDQSPTVLDKRFKGREYDLIYFDEGTGFTWECFTNIASRNRGKSYWTGKIRLTTNPEREHWLRTWLDWYIGPDGFIIEERDGVVRYFYMAGPKVEDVVWGDSKEEVYEQCKIDIDGKLSGVFGRDWRTERPDAWKSMIKSFCFYLGRMSENKAMLENNEGYIGTVAMSGGAEAAKKLEGNWNVSSKDEVESAITISDARAVFTNDPQTNNDKWITADLADSGTDNMLALCWNGFHVYDMKIISHSTPRENARALHVLAVEHDIADDHIIYDAIRGTYINDYIPDARQYVSYRAVIGLYGRQYVKLKDECYGRLVEVIKRHLMSFSPDIAKLVYSHQLLKENITVQAEFCEEAMVVMFKEATNGKKTLMTKKEMNKKLGRGRSMDLLDPCAMRMMPVLEYPYGEELISTIASEHFDDDEDLEDNYHSSANIYDEDTWC